MAIIDKPSDYFDTKLYTGNGGTQSITMDFATNFIWNKQRNGTLDHYLFNSVTGTGKFLKSNSSAAEGTNTDTVTSFDSDGFTLGSAAGNNGSGNTMVSWNWKELAGVFDIVSYTGNGSNRNIAHNLGAVPTMMIVKRRDSAGGWIVYHQAVGNTKISELHVNDASQTSSAAWNNTTPTTSVFTLGDYTSVNTNNGTYIAYLFGDTSMSKMGSYVGNGSNDGVMITTMFKPAFVMCKRAVGGTGNWGMNDTKRDPFNGTSHTCDANNAADADDVGIRMDILSNGFKLRTNSSNWNASGSTYIFMCFASNPFQTSTGVPTTAR